MSAHIHLTERHGSAPDTSYAELLAAAKGALGLFQLLAHRPSELSELSQAIITNHRFIALRDAIEKAERVTVADEAAQRSSKK